MAKRGGGRSFSICHTAVESTCPPFKPTLTDRVPDLQFDLLALDVDHPGAELPPDGQVVDGLEALVRELEEEAGLAHPCTRGQPG